MVRAVAAAGLALGLAACSTSGGGSFGSGARSGSSIYIAALQGGIVSRTGAELSRSDLQRALEAEYRALEAAPGGQPISWQRGDVRGEVVAAAPYQVGQQNCRQLTHKVFSDGREVLARGAACRNPSGTWTPLT
ncbi:hypothetical protein [Peteryoungia desertarenae]